MLSAGTIQTRNPADAGLLGQVDVKCPSLKDGHLARPSHVLRQVHLNAHLNRVRQDILGEVRESKQIRQDILGAIRKSKQGFKRAYREKFEKATWYGDGKPLCGLC